MSAQAYQIEEVSPQSILSARVRGKVEEIPQLLGRIYGEIVGYLGELGETPAGPPFVVYYNEDMQDLDMEVGFPVAKPFPGRGQLQPGTLAGGRSLVATHQGSYQEVEKTYQLLKMAIDKEKLVPQGQVVEYYLNDPAVTPENQLLTRIVFPLG